VSSRTARATQRNPVSKTKTKTKKNKKKKKRKRKENPVFFLLTDAFLLTDEMLPIPQSLIKTQLDLQVSVKNCHFSIGKFTFTLKKNIQNGTYNFME
jgi:predicted secreted protein